MPRLNVQQVLQRHELMACSFFVSVLCDPCGMEAFNCC